ARAGRARAPVAARRRPARLRRRTSLGRRYGSAPGAVRACSSRSERAAALGEQLPMPLYRRQHCIDVLDAVVCVRGDAEIGVAFGRDDALAAECCDERERVLRPVAVGHTFSTRSRFASKKPGPAEPSRYFSTPAPRKSTPSSFTSTGNEPTDWNASSRTCAPRSCARSTILRTSIIAPLR